MKLKKIIKFGCVFVVIIFLCMSGYLSFSEYIELKNDDLTIVTEYFSNYKKSKGSYSFSCISGNEYKLEYILAADENIDAIQYGDEITLGIVNDLIIELTVNGEKMITLDDCHERYIKRSKIATVVIIIMVGILGVIYFAVYYSQKKLEAKLKEYDEVIDSDHSIDYIVYEEIQDSIYSKENQLHCNVLEQIESDELVNTFCRAILDYINEDELVLIIDDSCLNDELALIFYKLNDKLYFNQCFRDGNEPFIIERQLFWYFPMNSEVTKEEQQQFHSAIEKYAESNRELLKIREK